MYAAVGHDIGVPLGFFATEHEQTSGHGQRTKTLGCGCHDPQPLVQSPDAPFSVVG